MKKETTCGFSIEVSGHYLVCLLFVFFFGCFHLNLFLVYIDRERFVFLGLPTRWPHHPRAGDQWESRLLVRRERADRKERRFPVRGRLRPADYYETLVGSSGKCFLPLVSSNQWNQGSASSRYHDKHLISISVPSPWYYITERIIMRLKMSRICYRKIHRCRKISRFFEIAEKMSLRCQINQ